MLSRSLLRTGIQDVLKQFCSSLILAAVLVSALSLMAGAQAVTQATMVNPQAGELISPFPTIDVKGDGTLYRSIYLLNGTCHNSDAVSVTISPVGGGAAIVSNQLATVKGGLWEFVWLFPQGLVGSFNVAITPSLNSVAGTTLTHTATMMNISPGFRLDVAPSSVISQVYTGKGASKGGMYNLPVTLHMFSLNNTTGQTIAGSLSGPNSNAKPVAITINSNGGSPSINNDAAGANGTPATYVLGSSTLR